MTDIRKVITPQNVGTMASNTNFLTTPAGDRPVYLSRMGFLDTDSPTVLSSVQELTGVNTQALAQTNSNIHNLGGDFWSFTRTLNPCDLDPRRLSIRGVNVATGTNPILTFPQPKELIDYLKGKYGADNITAGLYWEIRFINDTTEATPGHITLTIPVWVAPQTVTTYGWYLPGGAGGTRTRYIKSGTGTIPDNRGSTTIGFLITNVTPNSEGMIYYAFN